MATTPVIPTDQAPPQQTLAQLIRAKHPGAYDDLDDVSLESKVLQKFPQYSDLPRTKPESQAPDALAQSKQVLQNIPKFTSPEDELRGNLAASRTDPKYNEYMRQSGSLAGSMAGGMATGGLLPAVKGAGLTTNFLRLIGRTGLAGAGMGAGALAGGATPEEAKGAAVSGAVGQPIGEGVGAVMGKLAPSMAESALRVTDRMRGRGRTIGQTVLDQTSGVNPATIASQAGSKLKGLTSKMEGAVNEATTQGGMGTTQPAHDVINSAVQGIPRNAKAIRDKVNSLHDLLELGPPGTQYTPNDLLEMKRGIGKEIQTWPPEWQRIGDVRQVQQRIYGAIDKQIDNLVPGNADINQKISSLIPAKQQAMKVSNSASAPERMMHRVAAHTGAATLAGLGGALGYKEGGGAKGAALGIGAGLALPEFLASPTAQMAAARMIGGSGKLAANPALQSFLKAIAASKKPADDQDEAEKQ